MTDKADHPSGRPPCAADPLARLAREASLLEEGREDIRAGRCISDTDVDAWLDGVDGDRELPVPKRPNDRSRR